jgi:hypothetical protein
MPRILSGSHWREGGLGARVGAMIKIGKKCFEELEIQGIEVL